MTRDPRHASGGDGHAAKAAVSYGDQRENLLTRLRRIEGQVRGLQRMVEEDRYCIDILTQLAAVQAALSRVGFGLIESHTRKCVARALQQGEEAHVDELLDVLRRFVK